MPKINSRLGELWIGTLGIFYYRIYGVELPSGRFIGTTRGWSSSRGWS